MAFLHYMYAMCPAKVRTAVLAPQIYGVVASFSQAGSGTSCLCESNYLPTNHRQHMSILVTSPVMTFF